VAAGTGKEQHAELLRLLVGTGECRELPWLAERAPFVAYKRQLMRAARLEVGRMKVPVLSAGVAHAAAHRSAVDTQCGCDRKRRIEGRFNQQPPIAHGWQEMADRATVPGRTSGRGHCGLREQIGRRCERKGGSGSAA